MTMLQVHATALSSEITTYHEFLQRYSKRSKVVYGFVEGRDDPGFYRGYIEAMLPRDWSVELWLAGNKDRVYRIHALIDWRRFPKCRLCFFVDRDLSDLVPERRRSDVNIYVTSGYSIENDLVSRETFHRILTELCGFGGADHTEVDQACALFEGQLDAFLLAMIPIMAWIVHWRRSGHRPELGNLRLSEIFSFVTAKLQWKAAPDGYASTAAYIHDRCHILHDTSFDTTSVEAELQANHLYRSLTRGKYVLWFLVEFCNAVRQSAPHLFSSCPKPPKMHVNLSTASAVSLIGGRARIPASLELFITNTYLGFVGRALSKSA